MGDRKQPDTLPLGAIKPEPPPTPRRDGMWRSIDDPGGVIMDIQGGGAREPLPEPRPRLTPEERLAVSAAKMSPITVSQIDDLIAIIERLAGEAVIAADEEIEGWTPATPKESAAAHWTDQQVGPLPRRKAGATVDSGEVLPPDRWTREQRVAFQSYAAGLQDAKFVASQKPRDSEQNTECRPDLGCGVPAKSDDSQPFACNLCGWQGPWSATILHPSGGRGCPGCIATEGLTPLDINEWRRIRYAPNAKTQDQNTTQRRDWQDIQFIAVAEPFPHHVDFKVYAIEGISESGEILFHRSGAPTYPDPVDSIIDAELYLHGSVKGDGCSNWYFDEQDSCMLHGCDRGGLVALGEVMARCWDWAAELIPTWDGG